MKWIISVVALMMVASVAWGQVPSEDFETWDSVATSEVAPGWNGGPFGSGKAEIAHGGKFAASVWNWYYYGKGYMMTMGEGSALPWVLEHGGVPISYKPAKLTGYYRYVLGENSGRKDSAVIFVMLKHYNGATGNRDTIGFASARLGPSDVYIPFTIDIRDYAPGVDPDSAVIAFVSSDSGFCSGESNGNCCYLSVDDLQLVTASGVPHSAAPLFVESARVLPNPMRSEARVRWNAVPGREYRMLLYDAAGRLAGSVEGLAGGEAKLDRAGLPAGAYRIEIRDNAGAVAARGQVVVER